jgi:unsaturated rhamnogalacturonyl hydrolase
MKKMNAMILSGVISACFSSTAVAQSAKALPPAGKILALMLRADHYQIANPVMMPDDRNWERGTWYTGVMEDWKTTHDKTFLNQALEWGRQSHWQVGQERLGANRLFCAETWTELSLIKNDPAMIEPTVKWLKADAPNSPAGARRWYLDGGKPYVDSLYGAAVFPMLARATGDGRYLATMRGFFDDVSNELWDQDTGLYYRDPTFIGKRDSNHKKIFWSRGNGWAFAGIARILEYLPGNDPDRPKYLAIFKRIAGELVKLQGPDGFWRTNLADPDEFPNPESSGTGFFCFGLAWGINHGILDRKTYLPSTERAFAALESAVNQDGKVGWGQQVDSQPNAAQPGNTQEYVTGAFLLAAGEVYKLAQP